MTDPQLECARWLFVIALVIACGALLAYVVMTTI